MDQKETKLEIKKKKVASKSPLTLMLKQDVISSPIILTTDLIRRSYENYKVSGELDLQGNLLTSLQEKVTIEDYSTGYTQTKSKRSLTTKKRNQQEDFGL
ncbi:hypothetical protein pb186bvf_017341 [Paramecium bursaria]